MTFPVRWNGTGEKAIWLTACQAGAQHAAPLQMPCHVMSDTIGIEVRR